MYILYIYIYIYMYIYIYIYILYLFAIFHFIVSALYESTPDYIPIHHIMYVEYGNKPLLLLLLSCGRFVLAVFLDFTIFSM